MTQGLEVRRVVASAGGIGKSIAKAFRAGGARVHTRAQRRVERVARTAWSDINATECSHRGG